MATRILEVELRCLLCGRGYEIELERLDQLPACGSRCVISGCGGTLFVAGADARWSGDEDEFDWDADDGRRKRGRPRKLTPSV